MNNINECEKINAVWRNPDWETATHKIKFSNFWNLWWKEPLRQRYRPKAMEAKKAIIRRHKKLLRHYRELELKSLSKGNPPRSKLY